MKIGIPNALLYAKYNVFAKTFFGLLGAQTVVSPDTNKHLLNNGAKLCVDEACLPVKIFHGHAAWLAERCDRLFFPRFQSLAENQLVCPMLCGLIEMVSHSVPGLPPLIDTPIDSLAPSDLFKWSRKAGAVLRPDTQKLKVAFKTALIRQRAHPGRVAAQSGFSRSVALIGHSYIIHDRFVSMNLIAKLNARGIGIMTADSVPQKYIDTQLQKLFKRPFWYFARQFYGSAVHLYEKNQVDGIIYVSAFSCGVDSVVVELIKSAVGHFPLMVLKIDEHTGEAGFDTRVEAFADILERRPPVGYHLPAYGERLLGSQGVL